MWLSAENVVIIVDRGPVGHEMALAGAKNTLGEPSAPHLFLLCGFP
jgi:hypothetical protein